ncbi:TetR/AcrR family transcriptional regulator [Salininema proteolyticum]|uniref:TetR/AcrR family transcriptional regulator n=1 Tax=Salininema proteolyticum TaxID=1607685 RepID=A0ABV8TYR3_9ACTN
MARAGLTPDRVTAAGLELADDLGFDNVTLSVLARHFGVKTASLYSHISDAEDLKTRIVLRALDELADLASQAIAGRSGKEALAALGGVYRDYARDHPGRYAATHHRLDSEAAFASAGPRHTRMVRAILRGYDIEGTEATHAVRLLGSVFDGYASLELGGAFDHSEPGSEESWERAMDALDSLLRNWPAP